MTRSLWLSLILAVCIVRGDAQAPLPPAVKPPASGEITFTASSANVAEPGIPIKIRILRWSTDEERAPLIAALTPPRPAPAAAGNPPDATPARGESAADPSTGSPAGAGANPAAAATGRSGAARAGGSPAGAGANPAAAAGAARGRGAAGRGRGGRGGRGDAAPNPIAALTAVINRAPTLGYIWTNDITGYSIKYAARTPLPDGGERIILATDRRLGAHTTGWKPAGAAAPTDYEFTFLELRVDQKGSGEGKASLTARVTVDADAKTVALENYAAAPVILQNVKR
jgi:hypothetical protein